MTYLQIIKRGLFMLKARLIFAGTVSVLLFYVVQHRLWDLDT